MWQVLKFLAGAILFLSTRMRAWGKVNVERGLYRETRPEGELYRFIVDVVGVEALGVLRIDVENGGELGVGAAAQGFGVDGLGRGAVAGSIAGQGRPDACGVRCRQQGEQQRCQTLHPGAPCLQLQGDGRREFVPLR